MYYLSVIAWALIEHADLAFSLSPNNHYGRKSKMASLHMSRIPSSQWLKHVCLYIESIFLLLREAIHSSQSKPCCRKHTYAHVSVSARQLSTVCAYRLSIHRAHAREGLVVELLKVIWSTPPPPPHPLPVSNQDKSSTSEEVLPF